jgi:hypothetical protein
LSDHVASASGHVLIVGQSFTSDEMTSSCTCGWESPREFDNDSQVLDAWENHCDVVFMEATS